MTDLLFENVKIHFIRIATQQIVNQLAYSGITFRHAVYINNVRTISKSLAIQLPYRAVNLVYRLASTHHVVLGDEDDVGVAQLAKVLARLERVRVHQRGVVPSPLRLRAIVRALDFDVIFPALGIPREHVETNAATLKALNRVFGLRLDYLQVLLAKYDPQYQLNALRRVFKAL